MRRFLISLVLVSCSAFADDMADANKYLVAKDYSKALPIYTRLANAGNPEAQFRLGEMYWYGDGTAQDLQAAYRWFEKAAATGHADAKESLVILERRKTRGAEIDYWMKQYNGADLRSGQFDCKPPVIPQVSKTNVEITATRTAIEAWQACHDGFAANFNSAMPVGKRIPQEVLDMMSPNEFEQVRVHLTPVYGKVLADEQAETDRILAQKAAWATATERFVKEENARIALENTELERANADRRRSAMEQTKLERTPPAPAAPAPTPNR